MSVPRCRLVQYLEKNGFSLLREGSIHSIYTNGVKTIPVKRPRTLDRVTANELSKQARARTSFLRNRLSLRAYPQIAFSSFARGTQAQGLFMGRP